MGKTIKYIYAGILACSVLLSSCAGANAATIRAASCSLSDVNSAVRSAGNGDTVEVPAGNCVWSGTLFLSKGITIRGAGSGSTIITDATGQGWQQAPLWIEGAAGRPFRITGITFRGQSDSEGLIRISGYCKNFRIDNCAFENEGRSIVIKGNTYGLIDRCTFTPPSNNVINSILIEDDAFSWSRPLTLGTVNAVYVEDCVFNMRHENQYPLDAQMGARYVFRKNRVFNGTMGHHGPEGGTRGALSCEIYENTYSATPTIYRSLFLRGGTGVIFNNTWTGNFMNSVHVTNYRTCYGAGAGSGSFSPPYNSRCNGSSSYDGNTPGGLGYPCIDQVGRGANQAAAPLYEWNNTLNGSNTNITVSEFGASCVNPSVGDHIKVNRDYYNDTPRPGYSPLTYPHPLVGGSYVFVDPPSNLHIVGME